MSFGSQFYCKSLTSTSATCSGTRFQEYHKSCQDKIIGKLFYVPILNPNFPLSLFKGESPLHTACRFGLASLTAELLQQGANPNLQTQKELPDDTHCVAMQTPLHMAIAHNHSDVVSVILEQKGQCVSIK